MEFALDKHGQLRITLPQDATAYLRLDEPDVIVLSGIETEQLAELLKNAGQQQPKRSTS